MEKEESKLFRTPRKFAGIGRSPEVSSLCSKSLSQIFVLLLKEVRVVERRTGI